MAISITYVQLVLKILRKKLLERRIGVYTLSEKRCPKCEGEMEERKGKWSHNLTVKKGTFGMERPKMYVCGKCGYIEFYLE